MTNTADTPSAHDPFDPAPADDAATEPVLADNDRGKVQGRKARANKPRIPGPITPDYLFRAAAHYIERYATSSGHLRRVLERKVMRRARARGEPAVGHEAAIAATVERFAELKLVDDERFAEARLASLRRRGTSARMAAAKLSEKGVDRQLIEAILAADESDDRTAALAHARRRRLGPYRSRDREARRDRDVAAMVRAGFSYGDAAAIVDGEPVVAPGIILPSSVRSDDEED